MGQKDNKQYINKHTNIKLRQIHNIISAFYLFFLFFFFLTCSFCHFLFLILLFCFLSFEHVLIFQIFSPESFHFFFIVFHFFFFFLRQYFFFPNQNKYISIQITTDYHEYTIHNVQYKKWSYLQTNRKFHSHDWNAWNISVYEVDNPAKHQPLWEH